MFKITEFIEPEPKHYQTTLNKMTNYDNENVNKVFNLKNNLKEIYSDLENLKNINKNFKYLSNTSKMNDLKLWNNLKKNGKSIILMLSEIMGVKLEYYETITDFIKGMRELHQENLIMRDIFNDIFKLYWYVQKEQLAFYTGHLYPEWNWYADWNPSELKFNYVKEELIKCRERRSKVYNKKMTYCKKKLCIYISCKKNTNLTLPCEVLNNILDYIGYDGCDCCQKKFKSIDIIMSHYSSECVLCQNLHSEPLLSCDNNNYNINDAMILDELLEFQQDDTNDLITLDDLLLLEFQQDDTNNLITLDELLEFQQEDINNNIFEYYYELDDDDVMYISDEKVENEKILVELTRAMKEYENRNVHHGYFGYN